MSRSLWKKTSDIDELNRICERTIHAALGIRFTEVGEDSISAEMPVDERTKQPFGVLHGGASVVLAESLGSMASYLALEGDDRPAYGIEISASHLKAARNGVVTGTAKPIRVGNSLHVWQIEIRDGIGDLVCLVRLTVSIREPRVPRV